MVSGEPSRTCAHRRSHHIVPGLNSASCRGCQRHRPVPQHWASAETAAPWYDQKSAAPGAHSAVPPEIKTDGDVDENVLLDLTHMPNNEETESNLLHSKQKKRLEPSRHTHSTHKLCLLRHYEAGFSYRNRQRNWQTNSSGSMLITGAALHNMPVTSAIRLWTVLFLLIFLTCRKSPEFFVMPCRA